MTIEIGEDWGVASTATWLGWRRCATSRCCCLQLDVTRCGGYTGWLRAAEAVDTEVPAHCAPSLHACAAAASQHAARRMLADHIRLESALFENTPYVQRRGHLADSDRAGHGMTISADAEKWKQPQPNTGNAALPGGTTPQGGAPNQGSNPPPSTRRCGSRT